MRSLERNKQTFYYALYSAVTEVKDENGDYTGEREITYSSPVSIEQTYRLQGERAKLLRLVLRLTTQRPSPQAIWTAR